MKKSCLLIIILALLTGCQSLTKNPDFRALTIHPTRAQVEYQQMELIGFIHYSINTFTDMEWGYGDESPSLFNPSQNNPEQWVLAAKKAGMKQLILTAKHHDGFCLWPSQYTEHSIKNSPYKDGQGDIVREFTDACRKHGLKAGLYLSPWDRNHPAYGRPEYIDYYRKQLTELLTGYGKISEIWFDGANGGTGYYGGSNETRLIDRNTYYGWDSTFALVKSLQPDIFIFSDAGPDVHWIGNENGYAGESFWSTIDREKLVIGQSDPAYLNTGDPDGTDWIIGQCDVSIRPGWFYHADQDSLVKSPEELIDIYAKSVGRNAVLLLNIPPDKRGLIHENDVKVLETFGQMIKNLFAVDLVPDARVKANNYRSKNRQYAPGQIKDNDPDTFWATDDQVFPAELILSFEKEITFDLILLQEPVQFGQRIQAFRVEILEDNLWNKIVEGTTIGAKRLLSVSPVKTRKIRFVFTKATNTVAISKIGVYGATTTSDH